MDIKELLKDHVEDLKNNNLDLIFRSCSNKLTLELRDLLTDKGIDPLLYVTKIPTWYYEAEELDTLDLSKYTNIKSIGEIAFSNSQIDTLILPLSIQKINSGAFYKANIDNLYLSNNLKEVNNYAFYKTFGSSIFYKGKKYNFDNILEALKNNGVKIII